MSQTRSFGRDRGKRAALRPVAAVSDRGLLISHLARPSKPTTATGLRRREESDQVHPKARAQETRTHPDEERGCSPATNRRTSHTFLKHEGPEIKKWGKRGGPETKSTPTGCVPLVSHARPRPFPSPAPLRASSRSLPKGNSRSFLCRQGKRAGNPRALFVVSPSTGHTPRARTLFNAERPAVWPVEDGVRSDMSGGDGGVGWWSSVVKWCLVQNNDSKSKTTT